MLFYVDVWLKKKGLFVKANDGITLDIYEGETFGLVGESGCGKSTLGRTLLQLYRQTDGRSMYYGRVLDELAPRYVEKTLKNIDKRRAQWKELTKAAESAQQEYDALPDGFHESHALRHAALCYLNEARFGQALTLGWAFTDEGSLQLDISSPVSGRIFFAKLAFDTVVP